MNEFQFTFMRYSNGGMEENGRLVKAASLEEAAAKAQRFCDANDCHIKGVEWWDEEEERWQQSIVCRV